MKGQWMKKIKKLAVLILTVAMLVNTIDCNQLFVNAEMTADAGEEGSEGAAGNEENDAGEYKSGDDEEADTDGNGSDGDSSEEKENDDKDAVTDEEASDNSDESAGRTEDEKVIQPGTDEEDTENDQVGQPQQVEAMPGVRKVPAASAPEDGGSEGEPEPQAEGPVSIVIMLQDKDNNPVSGATVQFTDGEGNAVAFLEDAESSGKYVSETEIDADGTIAVTKDGYESVTENFSLADYEDAWIISMEERYSYFLQIKGAGNGSVKVGEFTISGNFTSVSPTATLAVKSNDTCYIESITVNDNIVVENVESKDLTVEKGDSIVVTFEKKSSVTVNISGKGKVYWAGDTTATPLSGTIYFMPDSTDNLTVKADENNYIDSIKIKLSGTDEDGTEQIGDEITDLKKDISPVDGSQITIAFKEKWTADNLKNAVLSANSNLQNVANHMVVELHDPEGMDNYSYQWEVSTPTSSLPGVKIDKTESGNELIIPRNAAGKSIGIKIQAILTKGNAPEQSVETTIEVNVGDVKALEDNDYVLELKEGWIKKITVKTDAEGNNFTRYALSEPAISGEISEETTLALGDVEVQGASLTLSGTENGEDYSAEVTNLNIDTKAPGIGTISYSKKDADGNDESYDPDTDEKEGKGNKAIAISVEATDGGSGLQNAVLTYSDENGAEQTMAASFENGTASFAPMENGIYQFSKLQVYDNAGNVKEEKVTTYFDIDTAPPVIPKVDPEENTAIWLKGLSRDYALESSEDVVKFHIIALDENGLAAGEEIEVGEETEVIVGAENEAGHAVWNVSVEDGKVLNQSYHIWAEDGHTNLSEKLTYRVKIDNKKPEIGDISFTTEQGNRGTPTEIVTDSSFTIAVTDVKDEEAGLAEVWLAYDVEIDGEKSAGQRKEIVIDANGEGSVTLDGNDGSYYKYTNFRVYAKDKAQPEGNLQEKEASVKSVEIDKKGPMISKVDWNLIADSEAWYNGPKSDFKYEVQVKDDTKLKSVTIYAAETEKEALAVGADDKYQIDLSSENIAEKKVEFGEWVFDRQGSQNFADKKEYYIISVEDQFGNITWTGDEKNDKSGTGAVEVRIDETKPIVTGAENGKADIAYTFQNVKQPDGATVADGDLTDKDHLVNGKLISKEDVAIRITAEDPLMTAAGRDADGVASGIIRMELVADKNGSETTLFVTENENTGKYEVILSGENNTDTVYTLKKLIIVDQANNRNEYVYAEGAQEDNKFGPLTIVVDKTAPMAEFKASAYTYTYHSGEDSGLTGWYSAADGTPFEVKAQASDTYGVYTVQWYKSTESKKNDVTDTDKLEAQPDQNTDEAAAKYDSTRKFEEDQNQLYAVKVTDWAGNAAVFCVDSTDNEGSRVRIDNVAPDKYAWISWDGDVDSSFNEIKKGEKYEVPKEGSVYNRTYTNLLVYVRDTNVEVNGVLESGDGRVSSDIQRVEIDIDHDGRIEHLTSTKAKSVKMVEINNEDYLEYTFDDIKWTNADEEIEKMITGIYIYDNAGNMTPADAEILRDNVKYILDAKAPVLNVDYHDGSYVENALFPDTYFYKADPGVNATIAERYFFPEDVKMVLNEPESTGTLGHSGWSMGGLEHGSTFSAPGDGKYRFSLEYQDRSGNLMTGGNVEVNSGRFLSKMLVMDTTAPKIEITYEYGGHDVTNEIYDGNFFAGTVTAHVKIYEANFDPEMVEIEATAKSSENNSGMDVAWDGSWAQEGDEVWGNTVTFDAQGTYQFTCICRDIVGHEAERPAQSHFVVDTTKPEVEITYDLNDPMNEKYYKETRTATVRVTDRSFDPETTDFIIETSGPQPVIGEWVHVAGGGCENQLTYHVDHCVYEAKVVFAEDGDYSLGFQCVDRAGNESETVMTDPFTVDQTLPEMTITYDNNDARNDYYYNAKRIETIFIREHNFNPEDVQIVTTAQNRAAAVSAPSISGWRSNGDEHTTTIAYDYDADFTFDISYTDLAGNEAEAYAGDRFVVDMTAPVLEITDIEDKSANNATVAPGITYSDINLDTNGVSLSLTGANNGDTTFDTSVTNLEGGMKIQYQDFPRRKEVDDLYTFHATVTDLAGNVSEQTVMFSVNRFGSVYVFDNATQAILDRYYINQPAHLNITEINVDTLEFKEITYSKDGDIVTMNPGEDYQVTESGSDVTWKSYTYDISESNFTDEGAYAVTIYSEDRATNKSNNTVKEKEINFVMDTTSPTVVVTGVEDREQYNENSRIVTIDAKDNIYLAGVTAYLNDKPVKTFDEETLLANGGVVTMEIGNSNEWQTLYVKAVDAAGNEGLSDTRMFLITKNILIQWYRNTPLFWGSIAGIAVLAALIIFFLFYKKKKDEEEQAA